MSANDTILEVPAVPVANVPADAEALIKKRVLWAMGGGLVPIPLFDLAVIAGVQLKLIEDLSAHYGKTFVRTEAKNLIAVLTASVGTSTLACGTVASSLKIIPGFGSVAGTAALPVIAGTSTYALGKVFMKHFEEGGTLLDLKIEKAKDCFARACEEGQSIVVDLAKDIKSGTKKEVGKIF